MRFMQRFPWRLEEKKSNICEHKRTHTNKTGKLNSQKQTLVSAKTAGTANTIKFHDILKKLKGKPDLYKFWSSGPPNYAISSCRTPSNTRAAVGADLCFT